MHVDKYRIVARKSEGCPHPAELTSVHEIFLMGQFDPKPCPRIVYVKLHEMTIIATSPIKKGKGCKCKNGICGKACGFKKKNSSATVDALVMAIAVSEID